MVFQCPGLCLVSKLTVFHEVNLSSFSTVCRGLPHLSAEAAVLALFLLWVMDEAPCAAAHWAMAAATLGCWQHHSHTAWAVPTSSTAKPALTQASKIQKHQAWGTERKWGPSSRAAWLCAGVSPGLAARRTGKTVRHRQAPPTRLHYKQKHPDRNSCTWGIPEGSTSTSYGSWLSVLHKWIANAQTKMPTMVLTLGARLFSPSCAHGSQAAADWGLPPHFHRICNTTSIPEKLHRYKKIFLLRESVHWAKWLTFEMGGEGNRYFTHITMELSASLLTFHLNRSSLSFLKNPLLFQNCPVIKLSLERTYQRKLIYAWA